MRRCRRLYIVQSPENATSVVKNGFSEEDIVVVFSSEAGNAFKKKGLECFTPEELVSLPDFNEIGKKNIAPARNICEALDKKIQEKVSCMQDYEIGLFSGAFFYIKIFLDAVIIGRTILERLFECIKAERVIVFRSSENYGDSLKCGEDLIPIIARELFPARVDSMVSKKMVDVKSHMVRKAKLLCNGLEEFFNKDKRKLRDHHTGLILMNSHDVSYAVEALRDNIQFYDIHSAVSVNGRHNDEIRGEILEAFSEVSKDPSYRVSFPGGEDEFLLINQCLMEHVLDEVTPLLENIDELKDKICRINPKFLFTSGCRLNMADSFLMGLIKHCKVPVVTYQEGGGAGYLNWPMFSLDAELSDHFLTYGEEVGDGLQCESFAKVVPVGSLRLSNIKKELNKRSTKKTPEKIYVVLDIFKTSIWQHYPHNGGFFSEAYKHQIQILKILKGINSEKFVIKTIKGRTFLYEDFVDNKNIFITTKPLASILSEAKAFVLDWPSTVLQECLLTDKPISLLYNENAVKFNENAKEFLDRRVYGCSDVLKFEDTVRFMINEGYSNRKNKDFQDKYCTEVNAAENVYNFFEKLLKTNIEKKVQG